jgi:fumarate reductase iron-sulfur subunit
MSQEHPPQNGKPLQVAVLRYDPESGGAPYWRTYTVPRRRASRVLDVLEYIQDEVDPGLGYRRHICHNLVCHSCYVNVNGHARMTCQALLKPDVAEIRIEPYSDFVPIRDLIVDFAQPR